jgi:hypothetical protein
MIAGRTEQREFRHPRNAGTHAARSGLPELATTSGGRANCEFRGHGVDGTLQGQVM